MCPLKEVHLNSNKQNWCEGKVGAVLWALKEKESGEWTWRRGKQAEPLVPVGRKDSPMDTTLAVGVTSEGPGSGGLSASMSLCMDIWYSFVLNFPDCLPISFG